MKKIIKGKVYDTNTAENLGERCRNIDDPKMITNEILCRKRTGEYFLYGSGGCLTKYAVSECNNTWRGGKTIIPLSVSAAKEWAEDNLSAEKYEEIFGVIEEDGTKQAVTLSLSVSNYELAKRESAERGTSVSAFIDELIKNHVKGDVKNDR